MFYLAEKNNSFFRELGFSTVSDFYFLSSFALHTNNEYLIICSKNFTVVRFPVIVDAFFFQIERLTIQFNSFRRLLQYFTFSCPIC